ncbi:unnamed protein product [Vitrella brassicaformis CCMP3155]|uniref:Sugar phosphate transporter domain-containing protein n=2 Tax=Vitrella brassicaformis TaxID=1169539 RepID=A0A0G4F612_VITBC|nr:unnamed protein product [Vitrella brassicaformis CCMP3155]|eukprot:CEM07668.1 unnamed protein product [Vitrella brassicaformis CCMP3155]
MGGLPVSAFEKRNDPTGASSKLKYRLYHPCSSPLLPEQPALLHSPSHLPTPTSMMMRSVIALCLACLVSCGYASSVAYKIRATRGLNQLAPLLERQDLQEEADTTARDDATDAFLSDLDDAADAFASLMASGEGFVASPFSQPVPSAQRFGRARNGRLFPEGMTALESVATTEATTTSMATSTLDLDLDKVMAFLEKQGYQKSLSTLKKEVNGDTGSDMVETAKTFFFLFLWYAFNVLYNVDNKRALNLYPLPLTVSALQMLVGIPIFMLPWLTGIRPKPKIYNSEGVKQLAIQGLFHASVHISAVIALGAGAISFVHIVKAAEPVTTSVLSAVVLQNYLSPLTYLSLVPIIFGVSLASLKELSFTWRAFIGAMVSNVGSSLRGIYSKKAMGDKDKLGENLTPSNMYAILTIFATMFLVPLALFDMKSIVPVWNNALANGITGKQIIRHVVGSGFWYYLYNEVAFLSLSRLNTVSHAVANTFKRVALILASVIVFGTKFTPLGALGSAIAVGGTLLYGVSKSLESKKA